MSDFDLYFFHRKSRDASEMPCEKRSSTLLMNILILFPWISPSITADKCVKMNQNTQSRRKTSHFLSKTRDKFTTHLLSLDRIAQSENFSPFDRQKRKEKRRGANSRFDHHHCRCQQSSNVRITFSC